jgi:hypothetical protein
MSTPPKSATASATRRVPPADLLLAAAAVEANAALLRYDRDYERIAAVSDLRHRWLVPDGGLGVVGRISDA